ncbi:MAG: amidohydrolase [Rubrivivax sp.]|jgi:mannonate dehydratase|nr:amidohydrolase [Rubrivivax sp.]
MALFSRPTPRTPRRNDDTGATLASRRHVLCCGAAAAFAWMHTRPAQAAPWATECRNGLSSALQDFAAQRLAGLDPQALWDAHAHLLGNGDSGSGTQLHPSLTQGLNPIERARHRVILDAACVPADATAVDAAYLDRWRQLARDFPTGARWLLFAFEQAHTDAGQPDPQRSTLHVPDAHAQAVARRWPQTFEWVASIHPYRDDAVLRLKAAATGGARAIKWLPGAMNIDLRDPRCVPFYETLAALGLPLIVHCGEEKAVPGARRHDLGNPLHVRVPLARGVRVIVAHCASLGVAVDTETSGAPEVPAFDLFARLMGEQAHEQRLLGDISAVMQANRDARVWLTLLQRQAWHPRLLQGSDYPLPGLKWLTRLPRIVEAGLLSAADAETLSQLRESNALLFDLCLKRSLSLKGLSFQPSVFETRRHFVDTARATALANRPAQETPR